MYIILHIYTKVNKIRVGANVPPSHWYATISVFVCRLTNRKPQCAKSILNVSILRI